VLPLKHRMVIKVKEKENMEISDLSTERRDLEWFG
jgi:hypothetical protein